jgi:hypothetical protein
MIAELAGLMESHRTAQSRELHRDQVADLVHGGLVIAWRLDLDQLSNIPDHHVAPLREIREAALSVGIGIGNARDGFSGTRHLRPWKVRYSIIFDSELIDDEYDD